MTHDLRPDTAPGGVFWQDCHEVFRLVVDCLHPEIFSVEPLLDRLEHQEALR